MSDVFYDITDDAKREVLRVTDLVALIGAVTPLKKSGRSWKGLCPFHGEKTPSFYVHPDKGFYYCFGCGAKGDAITFVRETERLEFPEAVAYLARLSGITLPARKSGTRVDRARETRVSEAVALAAAFFRDALPRHAAATALVMKRGLTPQDASDFGFGAAPDSWDSLKNALAGRVAEETLLEAGLLQKNPDTGRVYDRFRNRLTIEIRDARGEILGFGARALGDDEPKYLNSPESNRFSKGKLLYGLDRAREAIRKTDSVILVEGYFDRIALEKAGRAQAVASMGTALTSAQADLLARQATTVVVAYDGDAAGQAASLKAFSILLSRGATIKHLVLPEGHDPDSFLAAHGVGALCEAVDSARPLLDSLLAAIPAGASDPAARATRINEAAAILRQAQDPVLRHEFLSALSRGTGVPLSMLSDRAEPVPAGFPKGAVGAGSTPAIGTQEVSELPGAEKTVIEGLLNEWTEARQLLERIPGDLFTHPLAREIVTAMKEIASSSETLDFSQLEAHLGPDASRIAVSLLFGEPLRAPQNRREEEGQAGLGRIYKSLLLLRIRQLEGQAAALTQEFASAARLGGPVDEQALQRRKSDLLNEIEKLKSGFLSTRSRNLDRQEP